MFIQNTFRPGAILRDYMASGQELAVDENTASFEDQYIVLTVPVERLLWLAANKWKCPKNKKNRQILSADSWEIERNALLTYGQALKINQKAVLCSTSHNFGTSYLIWLEFTGPDSVIHKLDFYINEQSSAGDIYATKVIDGVKCKDFYEAVLNAGSIDPKIAKKLNSIGSMTWTGSTEVKVQFKTNSNIQQTVFEGVADACPFVELTQLDPYDNYLYKGDPGCLADYDLTVIRKDGTRITARIDLKLLRDLDFATIKSQNPHDAELIIASALLDMNSIAGWRFKDPKNGIKIEDTKEFSDFIALFKATLQKVPPHYIKINKIDTNTGKVDYEFYK